jgi:hypothetical protein
MFLFMLGGSLALGAGLFAVATYSEGALLATRTVAQVIGWLFIVATAAGAAVLRRSDIAGITAASVTLGSGLLLLYVTHFDWSEIRTVPTAYAAIEARHSDLKAIEQPSPALAAALGMKEIVIPDMPKGEPHKPLLALARFPAGLASLQALQASRCSDKSGFAWIVCQESARLEYCQLRQNDDAYCPSPIPQSYPG